MHMPLTKSMLEPLVRSTYSMRVAELYDLIQDFKAVGVYRYNTLACIRGEDDSLLVVENKVLKRIKNKDWDELWNINYTDIPMELKVLVD